VRCHTARRACSAALASRSSVFRDHRIDLLAAEGPLGMIDQRLGEGEHHRLVLLKITTQATSAWQLPSVTVAVRSSWLRPKLGHSENATKKLPRDGDAIIHCRETSGDVLSMHQRSHHRLDG